jgi:hypothetical protein
MSRKTSIDLADSRGRDLKSGHLAYEGVLTTRTRLSVMVLCCLTRGYVMDT